MPRHDIFEITYADGSPIAPEDDLRKPAERMTRDGAQAESEYTRSQRAEADATGRERLEAARTA